MPADPEAIALVALRDEPLSVDEVLDAVRHPACGGIALFVGVVRDHDHGDGVTSLDYEAHPSALESMRGVLDTVRARS
jgi:molybdopterin synthase catalytic subunit